MYKEETGYLNLLQEIRDYGEEREDRTGTGTLSSFGHRLEFDISDQFPLITTKFVSFKNVLTELLWFLKGDRKGNINFLKTHNNNIWNPWADANNNLGPVYGAQWRKWFAPEIHKDSVGRDYVVERYLDQIDKVIWDIKFNPTSRRHIVSAWNVADLNKMALVPCHMTFQFYVTGAGRLDCQLYQRSADMFLGVPYNIASYSLLTYMIAQQTGLQPGRFIWLGGDCHIYKNHIEQVDTQLDRDPYYFPTLTVEKQQSIDHYSVEHFTLHNYNHFPRIVGEISV